MKGHLLWFMVAACLVVVGCDEISRMGIKIQNPKDSVLEVKIVNAPNPEQEAKNKAMEARLDQLEKWATKMGGRF